MNPQLIRARELECQLKERRRLQREELSRLRAQSGDRQRRFSAVAALAGDVLRALARPIESRY